MDPMIAVVLVLMGIAIGWIGRGLWSRYQSKRKHRMLVADLEEQFVAAMGSGNRDLNQIRRPGDSGPAKGGEIHPALPGGDDSVPIWASEGGRLAYPHGDHSGPSQADESGVTGPADFRRRRIQP